MISSLAWIARGKAARHPTKYSVDDSELERVSRMAKVELGDAAEQLAAAQGDDEGWVDEDEDGDEDEDMEEDEAPAAPGGDEMAKYRLDAYDEEPSQGAAMGAFSRIRGLQYYRNDDEDPYITLNKDEDEAEEREQLEVLPSDNMIITAKTEDDLSLLEAHIYAAQDENLYVHHDLMLPSFPLHLEWLDFAPAPLSPEAAARRPTGALGNFVAVGTMDPEIEVWSMDTLEGLFPDAVLGRRSETAELEGARGTGKKKRREAKPRIPNAAYHVDAVLCLSWNRRVRNMLASASADTTVKLWDLSRPLSGEDSSALRSFTGHTDKVQSVAWQVGAPGLAQGSENPAVLLTGSYDRTVRVFDSRMPEQARVAAIPADVEAVRWNGWHESAFLVALENGIVQGFDARMLGAEASPSALFTLAAHEGACTALDVSPHIPGCLLTAGTDRQVKVWSVEGGGGSGEAERPRGISLVAARDLDVGKVFTASFSPNDALTVAAAGSSGRLSVWDTLSNAGVRRTFGDRLRNIEQYAAHHAEESAPVDLSDAPRAGVVGVDDDAESDEEEDME